MIGIMTVGARMQQVFGRQARRPRWFLHAGLAIVVLASGCAGRRPPPAADAGAGETRELLDQLLPRSVSDRGGWITDLSAAFASLAVTPTLQNVCAVAAVIEQESSFQVDPVVPGLPAIAWREIDDRAAHAGVPKMLVHGVLGLNSSNGKSYAERIDGAKTEKQLSDVYEDFIGSVPMGRSLFAGHNPIRTRGPMQVHVLFAEQFAAKHPYPYPVEKSISDEVFTRHGGVYFGIAHLLDYSAPYERYLYRFADFNAGQYASRNAAFQSAVRIASGIAVTADGALLPHDAADSGGPGETELAVRALSPRLELGNGDIRDALEQSKSRDFETTSLYVRVFALAEQRSHRTLPRAVLPSIELRGPKLTRKLTTAWYAGRVNDRYERCLQR